MAGSRLRRAGFVVGAAAVLTLATNTAAWVNWTAAPWGGNQGKLSQQWVDESYNEINFTGCDEVYGRKSVDIALWQQIDWGSDKKHDTSTFTNCFNGTGHKSTATQTGLPYDSYYFEIDKIGSGCVPCAVIVDEVNVDTTKAD
ncbi:hypothetical protein [Streptomyces katsurahamanus]|uniref:Uncharacterized protein n=1 Tax=Streptomyces katsurahamanus TaxID=2577098 RepID=A0ABW9NZL6_9ACTN|nr:hypothetical protein [Streptomyces katsurahamanus]MQS38576.1 hypothetical protein [Streptomyces katsurahamanus]